MKYQGDKDHTFADWLLKANEKDMREYLHDTMLGDKYKAKKRNGAIIAIMVLATIWILIVCATIGLSTYFTISDAMDIIGDNVCGGHDNFESWVIDLARDDLVIECNDKNFIIGGNEEYINLWR